MLVIGIAIDLYAGYLFVQPWRATIGRPPADLGGTEIVWSTHSGDTLHGWFVHGDPGRGVIVLVHGIHADRRVMLPRARFLHRAGYSVFLFDLQAHGESSGDRITFGAKEGHDVQSAVALVRRILREERVGVIAVSLGGAAALLAPQPLEVDALVIESVYPTIVQATRNRVGPILAPLLLWQIEPRLGLSPNDLRPIDAIGRVRVPIFVISGEEDRHTTPAESRAMFAAAPEPKEFWLVPHAAHEDLCAVAGQECEKRILAFFARYVS